MPDIPAASPVSPASSVPAQSGNNIVVETTVNNVPDKIALLTRQIEVSGTIAEPPTAGSVTLNTVIGPLMLMLPQMAQAQQDKLLQQLVTLFQTQKPLTVVMQPGNPPSQAFLLLPPPAQTSQYQSAAAGFMQTSSVFSPQPAMPMVPNTVLTAVVLPGGTTLPFTLPEQAVQTTYANLAAVTPNTDPALPKIPDALALPTPSLTTEEPVLPNPVFPQTPPSLPPTPPAKAGNAPTPLAALLKPGTEVTLRIDTVIIPPPPGSPSLPPPVLQNNQILATVTGNGTGGQVILKAGDTTLFVRQPVDAEPGTQLVLTVEPSRTDIAAYVTASDQPQFNALQQIMAALQQIDPGMAHAILTASVPQPTDALPGALLFFLSIVRQGDVRNWLGSSALDMLVRAGKADLVAKLAQELQQAVTSSRDPVVGEWKTYQVPLQNPNHLGAFHFHVHNERQHRGKGQGGEGDDNPTPAQMRFLIDVRMSRLGPLQLDGFLRPRQLDIIVRSENPLPPWLNEDLRRTYVNVMENIGYTGGLNFQNGRQGWLNVQQPAAGAAVVT